MPQTEWRLKGDWIKNCNCAFGCPCDFNARPTNGNCKGLVGMHITDGHFGGSGANSRHKQTILASLCDVQARSTAFQTAGAARP
jgi:hypothetical protein